MEGVRTGTPGVPPAVTLGVEAGVKREEKEDASGVPVGPVAGVDAGNGFRADGVEARAGCVEKGESYLFTCSCGCFVRELVR